MAHSVASNLVLVVGEVSVPAHLDLSIGCLHISQHDKRFLPQHGHPEKARQKWQCLLSPSFGSLTPSLPWPHRPTLIQRGKKFTKCEYQEVKIIGGHPGTWLTLMKHHLGLEGEGVREEMRLELSLFLFGLFERERWAWRCDRLEQQAQG